MVKGTNENGLIKANDLVKNENVLVKMFNQHYINIVKNYPGKAPNYSVSSLNSDLDLNHCTWNYKKYADHPSIVKIKNSFSDIGLFDFLKAHTQDIYAIIKSLNSNKATGSGLIPLKIIKATANIISTDLTSIINKVYHKVFHYMKSVHIQNYSGP